jgi:hypothetical protein
MRDKERRQEGLQVLQEKRNAIFNMVLKEPFSKDTHVSKTEEITGLTSP